MRLITLHAVKSRFETSAPLIPSSEVHVWLPAVLPFLSARLQHQYHSLPLCHVSACCSGEIALPSPEVPHGTELRTGQLAADCGSEKKKKKKKKTEERSRNESFCLCIKGYVTVTAMLHVYLKQDRHRCLDNRTCLCMTRHSNVPGLQYHCLCN